MARARAILQSEFPYSVAARCINRDWFALPKAEVWRIMSDHLYFCHHAFNARIHAFVLMSNHFHLLISTPDANLSQIMEYFMARTSRELTELSGRINQCYGSRHFRCLISNDNYFQHAYKYIYRNPIEASIVDRVEEYPFSTLYGLLGLGRMHIPVVSDGTLFPDIRASLAWLNQKPDDQARMAVRKALRKRQFALAKDRNSKKRSPLEHSRY